MVWGVFSPHCGLSGGEVRLRLMKQLLLSQWSTYNYGDSCSLIVFPAGKPADA
jgi:hypothetical protein